MLAPVGTINGCTGRRVCAIGIGPGMTIGEPIFIIGGEVIHTGGTPGV